MKGFSKRRTIRQPASVIALFFLLLATSLSAQERRLRSGYASLSGNMTPFWVAKEGGYFKKYGLDIDQVAFPSGNEGMAATIAGEIEFIAIAGSTTASANIGGSDVISLGITHDRLLTSLVVNASIQKPEDLRGKAIGISRFGTSIDTAARIVIQHYGMEPIRDVSLIQVGAVASAVGALRSGRIQAAILSYPTLVQARREGFREMLDIASLGMPYAASGITARKSFVAQRRDVAVNYVRAVLEAIARVKRDKPFALEVMGKYFRSTDKEMLSETYEVASTKYLKRVPYPTPEAFRAVLDELGQVNPKAKGQEPKRFYDDSILQELDKSGFINALYK